MSCAAEPSAARPTLEVADIVRDFGAAFRRTHTITPEQAKVLRAIVACRTAKLGGHLDVCGGCGFSQPSYNSCRDRHCPKCQGAAQRAWIEKRSRRVLPVGHFHVVFTVPAGLHRLAAFRREEIFNALFAAASQTLLELGVSRQKADLGLTMVLHTWTRDLRFHPHVHAIVTGGGLSLDGRQWIAASQFLAPVRVMGALFRGKLLAAIRELHARGAFEGFDDFRDPQGFDRLMAQLARKRWVVYAKRPFGLVTHVLAYLGRYTHRVGISNQRLVSRRGDTITIATKHGATTTVSGMEFLRRFVQHVLPNRFVKIRHYGLYASGNVDTKRVAAAALLPPPPADVADASTAPPADDTSLRNVVGPHEVVCPRCLASSLIRQPLPHRDTS